MESIQRREDVEDLSSTKEDSVPNSDPESKDTVRVGSCFVCKETVDGKGEDLLHLCSCSLEVHGTCFQEWMGHGKCSKCPQCNFEYEFEGRGSGSYWLDLVKRSKEAIQPYQVKVRRFNALYVWFVLHTVLAAIMAGTVFNTVAALFYLGPGLFLLSFPALNWNTFWRLWLWNTSVTWVLSMSGLVSFLPTQPSIATRVGLLLDHGGDSVQISLKTSSAWHSWPPSPAQVALCIIPVFSFIYHEAFNRGTCWLLGPSESNPSRSDDVFRMLYFYGKLSYALGQRAWRRQPLINAVEIQMIDQAVQANTDSLHRIPHWTDILLEEGQAKYDLVGMYFSTDLTTHFMAMSFGFILQLLAQYHPVLKWFIGLKSHLHDLGLPKRQEGDRPSVEDDTYWKLYMEWALAESDHVWVRYAIGLGVYTLVHDSVYIFYLWLLKHEKQTRRVKTKPRVKCNSEKQKEGPPVSVSPQGPEGSAGEDPVAPPMREASVQAETRYAVEIPVAADVAT